MRFKIELIFLLNMVLSTQCTSCLAHILPSIDEYSIVQHNNQSKFSNFISSLNQSQRPQAHLSDQVPLYLKILASIFYIISMILGIGGNTIVLLIFIYYQRVKSVTNFFIINLAISDLIFALLCIPTTYVTAYLIEYWPFSSFLCVFFNYMQTVSVTLTVYTLLWITIDKFWALVKPLKLRFGLRVCKNVIVFSWLFSLFISLPIIMSTKLTNVVVENATGFNESIIIHPHCSEQWPESLAGLSHIYNVFLLLIQYFIPLIILSFCYIKIGLVLRKSKAPGESIQNRDAKMSRSKKRMLKMCFMMVLTFMIFWAPLHFLNVYRFYDENIAYSKYFGDLFFVCHLLAVSRSFVNPFIYAWINTKFRHGLKYFLCCWCLSEKKYLSNLAYQNSELMRMNSFRKNKKDSVNSVSRRRHCSHNYRNFKSNLKELSYAHQSSNSR